MIATPSRSSPTTALNRTTIWPCGPSSPARGSYLIALRPDGTDELCDPRDEDTPPPKKQQPVYPATAKSEERDHLSEGTGLYAFVLVVSLAPLPAYRVWKQRVWQVPWTAKLQHEPVNARHVRLCPPRFPGAP